MTDRATCWSITTNNPTKDDLSPTLPSGWTLEGQIEKGAEGTEHFQGMLRTPQVRFSAVKKVFPRAHIEIARNASALQAYVHKSDTRVREVQQSAGLTVFQLQEMVLERWSEPDFNRYLLDHMGEDDVYLRWADIVVGEMIRDGAAGGIEYVAINPMWRTSWKKFGSSIYSRYVKHNLNKGYNAPQECVEKASCDRSEADEAQA